MKIKPSSKSQSLYRPQPCEQPSWPLIQSSFIGGENLDTKFACTVSSCEMDTRAIKNGDAILVTFPFPDLITDVEVVFKTKNL